MNMKQARKNYGHAAPCADSFKVWARAYVSRRTATGKLARILRSR